jgi:hypothetical protein
MTDLRQAVQQALNLLDSGSPYHQQLAANVLRKALEQPEQEPTCPKCKAGVLYECVACSSNNYPPKPQPPPEWEAIKNIIAEYGLQAIDFVAEWKASQRPWVGLEIEDVQDSYNSDYQAQTRAVEKLLKERNGY